MPFSKALLHASNQSLIVCLASFPQVHFSGVSEDFVFQGRDEVLKEQSCKSDLRSPSPAIDNVAGRNDLDCFRLI